MDKRKVYILISQCENIGNHLDAISYYFYDTLQHCNNNKVAHFMRSRPRKTIFIVSLPIHP